MDKSGSLGINRPIYDDGASSTVQTSKTSSNTVPNTTPKTRRKSTWYEIKGDLVGSANGGTPRCVHFQYYIAGTPIKSFKITQTIKRKTPIRPNLSRLSLRKTAVFVPLNAVWDEAYKWESQHGDAFKENVINMPSIIINEGAYLSSRDRGDGEFVTDKKKKITNNSIIDILLNSQVLSFDARGSGHGAEINLTIPRAIKMSYNFLFRPKNDIAGFQEFKETSPSQLEQEIYSIPSNAENQYRRGTKRLEYTNSWRREQQTQDALMATGTNQATHTDWQALRAELLRQANNEEKSDIEILSEFYGVKIPHENRPLIIGQKTVNIDDTIIAQSATTGESSLGTDGAVTTFIDDEELIDGFHSNVSGWILIFYEFQVEPQQVGCRARESFLKSYKDFYRKDLFAIKDDVMYNNEAFGALKENEIAGSVRGYKRKYSELSRLPSSFIGDAVDNELYISEARLWYTNHPSIFIDGETEIVNRTKIDYSDLAIRGNSIDTLDPFTETTDQFWFVGTKYCILGYDSEVAKELKINKWEDE